MTENITDNVIDDNNTKKRFETNARDMVFAIILVVASVLMSAFGICDGFRGGFTVTAVILFCVITVYLYCGKIKLKVFSILSAVSGLGVLASFIVTSNSAVRFWSFVVFMLLSLCWFTAVSGKGSSKTGDTAIIRDILSPVFKQTLPNLPISLASLFSGEKRYKKSLGGVILGVLIAIPPLFIIIPLLMSSDEAFSGMIDLAFENTASLVLKILLGIIIGAFVISYCFSLKKEESPEYRENGFNGVQNTVIISFLSVLSLCYMAYLFSQLAYFFSAFSGFLPKDYKFTVSAYARRGFFEMTVIAVINFFIIFISHLVSAKKNGKICVASRVLCTFISVFTLIIISTALSKMILYISSFGMTKLRITTSVFMLFLAVVFVSLIIRLYLSKVDVIKVGLISAAVSLMVMGIFNVNSFIAEYNYNAYKNKTLKSIDVSTISELGDEGIPFLVMLAREKDEEISRQSRLKLSYAYEDYYEIEYNHKSNKSKISERKYNGIGEWSFSRSKAYKYLEYYIKKEPDILEFKKEYYEHSEYL